VSGRFWAVALLIMGAQTVWHIYRVWLMKFSKTGRGYDEKTALDFNSLYYIATDIGCFVAGGVSLWLTRSRGTSPHQARRYVYAGACLLTSMSIFIPILNKGPVLLGTLLVIGMGALALFPCYYSFVQELSSVHVGRLTGILSMWVWAVTSPMRSFLAGSRIARVTLCIAMIPGSSSPALRLGLRVLAMQFLWRSQSGSGFQPLSHQK